MRMIISIAICKLLYFAGKRAGKGSSLPGRAALAVYPGVLKRVKLPETIIAVTGSNGKTSTTEMLAHALESCGMKVAWNHEGANQIEGIATLILRVAAFSGAVKCDALVMECDERYAQKIFEAVQPALLVVTNICRDQLTRNGHHEFIQDCIQKAVTAAAANDAAGGMRLVLNADDPYVTALSAARVQHEGSVIRSCRYFGISGQAARGGFKPGMYDDGAYCPVCKEHMTYDYRIAAHMGGYRCGACGHKRPEPDIEVTGLDHETGEVRLDGGIATRLEFPSLSNAYNLAAAIAAVSMVGAGAGDAARALEGYELKGGRAQRFSVGGRNGLLLVSKHENSLSYDQSLTWAAGRRAPCTVVIMVDSISRKYYTSETSWLWDVNFGILEAGSVQNIVLTGRYVNELAARFAMTPAGQNKISCVGDTEALRGHIESSTTGDIVAITCFSDKEKLLAALRGTQVIES